MIDFFTDLPGDDLGSEIKVDDNWVEEKKMSKCRNRKIATATPKNDQEEFLAQ